MFKCLVVDTHLFRFGIVHLLMKMVYIDLFICVQIFMTNLDTFLFVGGMPFKYFSYLHLVIYTAELTLIAMINKFILSRELARLIAKIPL